MAKPKGPLDERSKKTGVGNPTGSADRAAPPRGFDALAKWRDLLPPLPVRPPAPPTPIKAAKPPARAVVRMERKGRAGKEATVIEKLGLPPDELAAWCRELKQTLGCGGSVDGDSIVLQGDLRQRLVAVLGAKGVSRVTLG